MVLSPVPTYSCNTRQLACQISCTLPRTFVPPRWRARTKGLLSCPLQLRTYWPPPPLVGDDLTKQIDKNKVSHSTYWVKWFTTCRSKDSLCVGQKTQKNKKVCHYTDKMKTHLRESFDDVDRINQYYFRVIYLGPEEPPLRKRWEASDVVFEGFHGEDRCDRGFAVTPCIIFMREWWWPWKGSTHARYFDKFVLIVFRRMMTISTN